MEKNNITLCQIVSVFQFFYLIDNFAEYISEHLLILFNIFYLTRKLLAKERDMRQEHGQNKITVKMKNRVV